MRRVWVLGLVVAMLATLVAAPTSGAAPGRMRKFTIVFQGENIPAGVAQQIARAGGRLVGQVPEIGMVQAEGTTAMMTQLRNQPGIAYVAPTLVWNLQVNRTHRLQDTNPNGALNGPGDLYEMYQWDIKQVTRNGESWALNRGSHSTVVGILDTGVNASHGDLAPNFLGGRNFVPAGANGDPTETGDPNDYNDRHGHGSHVAGAVAGNGRIYGVGPNLGYKAYRVFGASGGAETAWITAAMVSAANDGVDVISMSLGGYDVVRGKVTWTDPDTGVVYDLGDDHADFKAWMRAVLYAVRKGAVVVAAAGNEGLDAANSDAIIDYLNAAYGPEGYHFEGQAREVPGDIPGVIAVSATGPDRSLASYSNWGRGFIDMAAPGGDFQRYPEGDWFTDMNLGAYMDEGDGTDWYVFMAGTSMATPKVAAVAALYIDEYKQKMRGRRPNPHLTSAMVKKDAADLGPRGYDAQFGWGMADAWATLR